MTVRKDQAASRLDPSVHLTRRRIEIIELVRHGLVEKQIAHKLGISVDTVAEHIGLAMRALSAKTAAQLVAEAIAHGFIEVSPAQLPRN